MAGSRYRGELLESLPAPVIAAMIENGIVAEWPFEMTRSGRYYYATAAPDNMWKWALNGNPLRVLATLKKLDEVERED